MALKFRIPTAYVVIYKNAIEETKYPISVMPIMYIMLNMIRKSGLNVL